MLKKNATATTTDSVVGLDLDPGHIAAAEVSVNGHITVTPRRRRRAAARHPARRRGRRRDRARGGAEGALRRARAPHARAPRHRQPAHRRAHARPAAARRRRRRSPPRSRPRRPDHIPMPMDEAILDFQSARHGRHAAGPRTRVVIVAVRREMIDALVAADPRRRPEARGHRPRPPSAWCARCAGRAPRAPCSTSTSPGLTNVAVANAQRLPVHARRRGRAELDRRRRSPSAAALTLEHARMWMAHVGLATPLDERRGRRRARRRTRAALEEGVHQLADTVRNSLNFYRMQESAETVERAVAHRPRRRDPRLRRAPRRAARLPVEAARRRRRAPDDARPPGRLTVAAGLAVEDR